MCARWTSVTSDPNSPEALDYRRAQLTGGHQRIRVDRGQVIEDLCRGKKVLDVGCVDHDLLLARRGERWLHQQVVAVARQVVGVDADEVGVSLMLGEGYDVIHADITGDINEVEDRGPFDVIVAGEVIEHLGNPQGLFHSAARLLAPGGTMIVTSPNPYAPFRARAGAFGWVWENVDHLIYVFPSGIAEMADRAGLRLVAYGAETPGLRHTLVPSLRHLAGAVYRRLRGEQGDDGAGRLRLPLAPAWTTPMIGGTGVYVLETAT
jgi:SAM-dependent methyltransferase